MVMRRFFRVVVCMLLMLTMAATPIVATPSMSARAASSYKVMRCNVDGGRLRKGPSGAYGVITTLDRGEKVIYSGQMKKAFCLVATTNGKIGYIYKNFLSNYGVVRKDQLYYTRTRNVKLYKKASTSAKSTTLKNRQFVMVYQKAGNWAYVKTMDGKGGFVPLSKIKRFS